MKIIAWATNFDVRWRWVFRLGLPLAVYAGAGLWVLNDPFFREENLLNRFSDGNISWIVAVGGSILATFFLRVYRWHVLLQSVGGRFSIASSFWVFMGGELADRMLPPLGTVFRCKTLLRMGGLPMARCLGTMVTVRCMDMLVLIGIGLWALVLEHEFIWNAVKSTVAASDPWSMLAYLLFGICFSAVALWMLRKYQKVLFERLRNFWMIFLESLKMLLDAQILKPVALTLLLWTLYYAVNLIAMGVYAETADLPLRVGLILVLVSSFSMLAPQGGLGTYHFAVLSTLMLYGVKEEIGLTIAILMHLLNTSVVLLFGGLSFVVTARIGDRNVQHG